ncbi:hypothetical protein NEUTE2DRAFT_60711, partial [Neurospora tetrasperma FGSC 2509]
LESSIHSDAIVSDIGGSSPANSLPVNCDIPIIISTSKKVKKYFTKEDLNTKGATIAYFLPSNGFI